MSKENIDVDAIQYIDEWFTTLGKWKILQPPSIGPYILSGFAGLTGDFRSPYLFIQSEFRRKRVEKLVNRQSLEIVLREMSPYDQFISSYSLLNAPSVDVVPSDLGVLSFQSSTDSENMQSIFEEQIEANEEVRKSLEETNALLQRELGRVHWRLELVSRKLDDFERAIPKTVRVPGFRPGRAPDAIRVQVVDDLVTSESNTSSAEMSSSGFKYGVIVECLDKMNVSMRKLLIKHELEEKSAEQCCEELGLPLENFENLLSDARGEFESIWNERNEVIDA